jgi:hypothetical protein
MMHFGETSTKVTVFFGIRALIGKMKFGMNSVSH